MHVWLLLPDHECLFVRGKAKNRLFGAKRLSFKVAALRVKFNIIDKKASHEFPDKIVFFFEGVGGKERVLLPIKAFIGSILRY